MAARSEEGILPMKSTLLAAPASLMLPIGRRPVAQMGNDIRNCRK